MAIEIVTVPCRADNYAFLIHESDTGETALVDAPEADAIIDALALRNWSLSSILITHHHDDHIDGTAKLRKKYGARVIGCAADAHRLPELDLSVADGETIQICGQDVEIWDVSGHTINHIAFIMPGAKAAFTADSLMALGCGRLFEGTFAMMWESLSKFTALPGDTMIYSGHEYTAANGKFALSIDPDNPDLIARTGEIANLRAKGQFTVPSLLSVERKTNPFLRASDNKLKKALNLEKSADEDVFAEIRTRKDRF